MFDIQDEMNMKVHLNHPANPSSCISLFTLQLRLMDLIALVLMVIFAALLCTFLALYVRTRKKLKTAGVQAAPKATTTPASLTAACPKCKSPNVQGAHFCRSCGSQLAASSVTCSACGESNLPTARFCRKCGKPLK
jgi:ribosomal protein L40E